MSQIRLYKEVYIGDIELNLGVAGYVDVDAGSTESEIEIDFDEIVDCLDKVDSEELIDMLRDKFPSDISGIDWKCESMADEDRIEFLEKVYNKFSLAELEKIFEGKI